ncbi:magnesium transporter CorA [Lichenibacterium minor]|jgi:magnesium transporter|uniref:Magnesium transporter CorA n=1 Tax=Lichenibacterium minor TaxID=2316528 RepID=A0A4V1RUW9_9HYPH|nr:magnesium transporter CorA family protein [Lichenibacterium minor]RYC32614.1 magnesium transporter CorA [Lichenibacterium minor]
MITLYDPAAAAREIPAAATPLALADDTLWVDLIDPSDEDDARVEQATGLVLPRAHQLAEIETSSRLVAEGDVLMMSTPVLYREDGVVHSTPVGFVLGRDRLVTVRAHTLKSFSDYVAGRQGAVPLDGPVDALLGLLDGIIARMADGMEAVGAELDGVSKEIFGITKLDANQKPVRIERRLAATLQTVGRSGDTTSYARDSLLGINRLLVFLANKGGDRIGPAHHERIEVLKQDVAALGDYETRLTDKVQFLLDSTLGFINIEQNRTFKLLTVISVIGIPPTFVVGLYGMNFKNMPEYDWSYGYEWGLFLVVLSIVVPIVYLKVKGWF